MPTSPDSPIPLLDGVRILDLTRNIAGPVATMLAAEMGADVIKVEPPGGDEMRTWPPFIDGESAYFVSCNRGKRSISLDLKGEQDRAIFFALLARADVVVENYRPGTLERMGLGWENVRGRHPRLVWVSVSGYGREGPRASAPGYDSMMQAYTGIMGITGERDGPPVRGGGSPIDIATAYLAFGTIVSGLYARLKTGQGALFGVSLMESGLGFMHAYLQGALAGLEVPGRLGSETMGIYPMGAFMTANGEHCLVQVSSDLQWKRLCGLLGADELARDPRFATNPDRVRNRDELRPLLQDYLSTRTAREWEALCLDAGVPVAHVRRTADVITDAQVLARDMIKPALLPGGREISTWGVPIKINGASFTRALAVPATDQHRAEILDEIKARAETDG
jgi:formyl-CoA transferase/CoA:oxalate CoA-transferase